MTSLIVVLLLSLQEEVEGAEGGEAHGVRLHAAAAVGARARSDAVRRGLSQPHAHDRVVSNLL